MKTHYYLLAATLVVNSSLAQAAEYSCVVTRKLDRERDYTPEQIEKYQYSNRIEESESGAFVSRCSVAPTTGKFTCDRYKVDRIAFDKNVKIKKYYLFVAQFDLQLFPDLTFLENNGRGGISYGTCRLVSP